MPSRKKTPPPPSSKPAKLPAETHQTATGDSAILTTIQGLPISDNQNFFDTIILLVSDATAKAGRRWQREPKLRSIG